MGLGGCYSCIKYLLFAFNLVFWLAGCALLAVGIWAVVDPESLTSKIKNDDIKMYFTAAASVLIAVGAVIMFVGFCGCCGAIRESQCMLATFFVFLFLFFILLLAIGIWLFAGKDTLKDVYRQALQKQINKWKDSGYDLNNEFSKYVKLQQDEFNCCGTGSMPLYGYEGLVMPKCTIKQSTTGQNCQDAVFKRIDSNLVVVGGVAIGLGVIMLLGMIFSMMLCCAIRDVEHV